MSKFKGARCLKSFLTEKGLMPNNQNLAEIKPPPLPWRARGIQMKKGFDFSDYPLLIFR
jgi:hypothetical protein